MVSDFQGVDKCVLLGDILTACAIHVLSKYTDGTDIYLGLLNAACMRRGPRQEERAVMHLHVLLTFWRTCLGPYPL